MKQSEPAQKRVEAGESSGGQRVSDGNAGAGTCHEMTHLLKGAKPTHFFFY